MLQGLDEFMLVHNFTVDKLSYDCHLEAHCLTQHKEQTTIYIFPIVKESLPVDFKLWQKVTLNPVNGLLWQFKLSLHTVDFNVTPLGTP